MEREVSLLIMVVKEDFFKEMIFELRLEGSKEVRQAKIQGRVEQNKFGNLIRAFDIMWEGLENVGFWKL